jgi:hypothetical protein
VRVKVREEEEGEEETSTEVAHSKNEAKRHVYTMKEHAAM